MIKRDYLDIIGQHYKHDPQYLDFGDASRSSGIMATFGPITEYKNLIHHIDAKRFVRHPNQLPHNDPSNFSRDQLIPLLSGCKKAIDFYYNQSLYEVDKNYIKKSLKANFARATFKYFPLFGICQNKDFLAPDTIWHWILCGKMKWLYWYAPLGYLWQILHIIFMTKVNPKHEQNQTICLAYTSGLMKLWVWLHPNWEQSIKDYWCGWRNQEEIAEIIIKGIKEKL
jgi:hypothetical protein